MSQDPLANLKNITPQQDPSLRINIKLSDTTEVKCGCGGIVFNEGMLLRRVSPLLAGPGRPTITPIPAVYCTKCGAPVHELLPKELQDLPVDVEVVA